MATLTLKYPNLNSAIQIGDHVFYTSTVDRGSYKVNDSISEDFGNTYIGVVKELSFASNLHNVVITIADNNMVLPFGTDYFFFVKDNNVNDSGVLGYYSQVKIENDSTTKAELFSVGAEVFESSK